MRNQASLVDTVAPPISEPANSRHGPRRQGQRTVTARRAFRPGARARRVAAGPGPDLKLPVIAAAGGRRRAQAAVRSVEVTQAAPSEFWRHDRGSESV